MKKSNPRQRATGCDRNNEPSEFQKLIEELRIYQLELKMQNEELRQREAELEASRQKYVDLYNFAPIGYCTLDRDGIIRDINLTGAKLLGKEKERLLNTLFYQYVSEEDREAFFLYLRKTFETDDPQTCELRLIGKNADYVQLVSAVRENGQEARISIIDITKRWQIEHQIRQNQQTLQSIIDLNSEPILLIDTSGTVIAANRATALNLKKQLSDIIGTSIYKLLPPEVAEQRRRYVEKAIQTGKRVYFEDQRGNRHFAHYINPEINEHGKVTRLCIQAFDITDRKRFEDMLRQDKERYHSFVETMPEGFIVLNKDLTVVYANDEYCRITQSKKKDLLGTSILDHLSQKTQKIVSDQFSKRKQGESAPYEIESILKDGRRIQVKVSPRPIFDSDGTFQGSFAVLTDISQQKQSEVTALEERNILQQQRETLLKQKQELVKEIESYTHSLKVLLKNSEAEKKAVEENFVTNVREWILPFVDKLKLTRLSDNQKELLNVIETGLNDMASPFIRRVKSAMWNFTPMEISVANLIREGRANQEIASILKISEHTVMFHRANIRKKLGLRKAKINLRTHLIRLGE